MKSLFFFLLIFTASVSSAQTRKAEPFKGANKLVIVNDSNAASNFKAVITTLLDNGYNIDKKDDEYLTVKTQPKSTKYNGIYFFNLQAKNNEIIITGTIDPNIEAGQYIKVKSAPTEISNTGMSGSEYKRAFALIQSFAARLPGTLYYEKN